MIQLLAALGPESGHARPVQVDPFATARGEAAFTDAEDLKVLQEM